MAWVRTRRAGKKLAHHSEAPEPLHWPDIPKKAWNMEGLVFHWKHTRRAYVHWERPASVDLDPKRRLLATGRYADEKPGTRKPAGAGVGKTAASQKTVNKKVVSREPRPQRAAAPQKAVDKKVVSREPRPQRAAAPQKAVDKEVVGRELRPRRAAATKKAVEKEVAGREPRPRQAAATKKRKTDGGGGDAPDSAVEAGPVTKRRSSRRGGAAAVPVKA